MEFHTTIKKQIIHSMKKFTFIILLCIWFGSAFSQEEIKEKEIKTVVSEVTVFIDGTQITREKTIDLTPGKTILKFVNLSPFIDAKSIQVKAEGDLTVLSVNHQQNFMDKTEKPQEMKALETRLKDLEDKIRTENTYLEVLKDEESFLQENRNIGGKNQATSVAGLREVADFYSTRLISIKMKEIERGKTLDELNRQKKDIENQLDTWSGKKEFPSGEIVVTVDAQKNTSASFGISYVVGNCGWFPSYDIRAKNIDEPVELIYKANVRQDTKIDWNNVKLRFSSADPNTSGVAPELKTYFLDFNTLPPVYNRSVTAVRGKVTGSNQEPLPGTSVVVRGTTIGTVTDQNGNYSITVPSNAGSLTVSFIGYQTKTLPISNSVMNVMLEEDNMELDEATVVAYGIQTKAGSEALQGKTAGISPVTDKLKTRIRGTNSLAIPSVQTERQITVDFEIKIPYTVKSDNKSYAVDMENYNLPVTYQYYSVPKIDKNAFLIANIPDWEKYNLLEGEANTFFEGTFVGKTLLDINNASDTLQISLGQDKNVSVSREKVKDYTSRQFIGNKKEETRAWRTTVKNNKNQKINMIVLDQVPVSAAEEIEVDVQQTSGASLNHETGEVKWEFSLNPAEKKEFLLRYVVKYPKSKSLIIE